MLVLKKGDGSNKYDALLDTYEEERRPIAERVATTSLKNLLDYGLGMDKALRIDISNDAATNAQAMDIHFDKSHPEHQNIREAVSKAQGVFDGELLEDGDMDTSNYHVSSIPGHQLLHAWLKKGDSAVSTMDLVRPEKFVLLSRNSDWRQAAQPLG